MSKKIKILLANRDRAGVWYYRTYTPSLQLQYDHNDKFDITIDQNPNWDDFEYLKQFDIIHFHKEISPHPTPITLIKDLQKEGVIMVGDIDDNPFLHEHHPVYFQHKASKGHLRVMENLKACDYVTTTTDYFANFLKKYNPNVETFQNGANPDFMPQFKLNKTSSDKIRVGYIAGSSHMIDIPYLSDVAKILEMNNKDSYQMVLCGFDLRGENTRYNINPLLIEELKVNKLLNKKVIKEINMSNGNIDATSLPKHLKDKYRGNFLNVEKEDIDPQQTCWEDYEKIITNSRKIIKDKKYLDHLLSYNTEEYKGDTSNFSYIRRFTLPVEKYAKHYNYIDISLAPLKDIQFNRCKSPLKIMEAGFMKCALVASDIVTYSPYIDNGKNGILVDNSKKARGWGKTIKKLVNNPSLVEDLGESLYHYVNENFHLKGITNKRASFYEEIFSKKIKMI